MSTDKRVDSTVNMTGDNSEDNNGHSVIPISRAAMGTRWLCGRRTDSVLTIAQAAVILGVSEDYARRLIEHGIITASTGTVPSHAHSDAPDDPIDEYIVGDDVLITARELHDYQARHEAAMQAYREDTAHIDEDTLWAIEDMFRAMDDAAVITNDDLKALTDILNS